jgi:ATP-dependent RNA helicase HelY
MLLAGLFHESDLLIAESIGAGHLTGLDPATMAGVVSMFVYEHRSSEPAPAPWFPSREVKQRWEAIEALSDDIHRAEECAGLLPHRAPDPTFLAVAFAWAAGESFAEVVAAEELSGGDFVRTMRQLLDLLRQIAVVAPDPGTRTSADAAADLLHRGVVAASLPVAGVIVP